MDYYACVLLKVGCNYAEFIYLFFLLFSINLFCMSHRLLQKKEALFPLSKSDLHNFDRIWDRKKEDNTLIISFILL